MGWLPKYINDGNSISSGNQGAQEGNLAVVFKFDCDGNFGTTGVKSIVEGRNGVLLDNHKAVVNISFPNPWWD